MLLLYLETVYSLLWHTKDIHTSDIDRSWLMSLKNGSFHLQFRIASDSCGRSYPRMTSWLQCCKSKNLNKRCQIFMSAHKVHFPIKNFHLWLSERCSSHQKITLFKHDVYVFETTKKDAPEATGACKCLLSVIISKLLSIIFPTNGNFLLHSASSAAAWFLVTAVESENKQIIISTLYHLVLWWLLVNHLWKAILLLCNKSSYLINFIKSV